jgi:Methyltransferase domain
MDNILPQIIEELKSPPNCIAPDVDGYTSAKVRMLLHRLLDHLPADETYLEIGCWQGATLVSALLDHPDARAVACDNWSEFKHVDAKRVFFENLAKYDSRLPKIKVFEQDCFTLGPRELPGSIGVYFYDGNHSFESQRRAITQFIPFLAKKSIVIIDDWNHGPAKDGSQKGWEEVKPSKLEFYELPANFNGDTENYWNGIGAFYVEK